jgi:hypothetical protein
MYTQDQNGIIRHNGIAVAEDDPEKLAHQIAGGEFVYQYYDDVAATKTEKLKLADAIHADALKRLSGLDKVEEPDTFALKLIAVLLTSQNATRVAEIKLKLADMLATESSIAGVTVDQLEHSIANNTIAYSKLIAATAGIKTKAKTAIKNANVQTSIELDALADTLQKQSAAMLGGGV